MIRLTLGLMLAWPCHGALTHFYEMNPAADRIMWDSEGAAHTIFYGSGYSAPETIFGGGVAATANSSGVSVEASALHTASDFTIAMWARPQVQRGLVTRRTAADSTVWLRLQVDSANRLEAAYENTSGNSESVFISSPTITAGDLVLLWMAYDASSGAIRIAINGGSWTIDSPAAGWDADGAASVKWDIGHVGFSFTAYGSVIGRWAMWDEIVDDTDRAEFYNSGSGRDYTYYNPAGFTPPSSPLTVTLIDDEFALDSDLAENTQGLYWLRPFPCKDWTGMDCTADYIWVRSSDHDAPGGNPDGCYIGWSSSPETLPSSWTKIKDGAALSSETSQSWSQLETPYLVYDGTDEVFLYAHANFASSSPVQQATHVWRTTDFSTWTHAGEALTRNMSGDSNERSHTGYAVIVRRGAGDWVASSLCRDGGNPSVPSLAFCAWSSADGLSWSFTEFRSNFDDQTTALGSWAGLTNVVANTYLAGLSGGYSGAGGGAYIAQYSDLDDWEPSWPPFHLFSHDGNGTGGDWLQEVRTYEEDGVVHLYAKWSYQEPSTIRYYRGTLEGQEPAKVSMGGRSAISGRSE